MQLKMFVSEMHSVQYGVLLQACADRKTLQEGKLLHSYMLKTGTIDELSTFLYNKLLIMYTKSGEIGDARLVFDKIPMRNLFSWTAMIEGYARLSHWNRALALFSQMHKADVLPDSFIFPVIIKVMHIMDMARKPCNFLRRCSWMDFSQMWRLGML